MSTGKKLLLFLLLIITNSVAAQLCSGTKVILIDTIKYYETVNWQLVFNDDFNDSTLDLTKWNLSVAAQGSLDGTGPYATLDNVIVSPEKFFSDYSSAQGVCKIFAKNETVTRLPISWNPAVPAVTYHYTSATLESTQQFGFGKYEIRCKIPKGKGFWPAFWLYGEKNGRGDEIDIFEFMNERNIFGEYEKKSLSKDDQMHYHYWEKSNPLNNVDHNCGSTYKSEIDYSRDYHTFTLIWNKFTMQWYIDGELIKQAGQWYDLTGNVITSENVQPSQIVFRNEWYPKNPMTIIFDFGIQSGDDLPDDSTPFPSTFDIDYIRYYSY